MTITDELLRKNETYAAAFAGPVPSAPRVAVVACMDARMDVYSILGLRPGEAHVIRNGGGVVTDDVERSVAISQRLLGTTEVIVMHHTECGMLTFTDADFERQLVVETGSKPQWAAGAFADLHDDVRKSVARLKASPFLAHTESIRGFVFDVTTGALDEVA